MNENSLMNANKTFRAARPPTRALKIKMDKSDKYNEVTLQKKNQHKLRKRNSQITELIQINQIQ